MVQKQTGGQVQTFRLIPYPADDLPELEIVGEVQRVENQLSIRYSVQGDVEKILLPSPSSPVRKDGLWKKTCFEFFLAVHGTQEYWEINMSPSGEWNVYRMDAYRQVNMLEETKISQLPFRFQKKDGEYSLDISVDLTPIIEPTQKIQIGIATIIQTRGGRETYWALIHPDTKVDFHLRDSFILGVRSLPTSAQNL